MYAVHVRLKYALPPDEIFQQTFSHLNIEKYYAAGNKKIYSPP